MPYTMECNTCGKSFDQLHGYTSYYCSRVCYEADPREDAIMPNYKCLDEEKEVEDDGRVKYLRCGQCEPCRAKGAKIGSRR